MNEPRSNTKRVHHIAIAVRDIEAGLEFYRDKLGLELEKRAVLDAYGVEVAMLTLANSRVELVQSLDPAGSVARFIERRGEGLHHICFTTASLRDEMESMRRRGIELLDEEPRAGLSGPSCFVHPSAHAGVLVQLVEVPF